MCTLTRRAFLRIAALGAAAAAVAHGRAAYLADRPVGLVASDVVEALPRALA